MREFDIIANFTRSVTHTTTSVGQTKYTAKFKQRVAAEARKGLQTTSEIARRYRIRRWQVELWKRATQGNPDASSMENPATQPKAANKPNPGSEPIRRTMPSPPPSDPLKSDPLVQLRRATGNPNAEFRPGQWEAIHALVNQGASLLVVERTGWGKSMVYFLATYILRKRGKGMALLISPLLALMRNQLQAAEKLGLRAVSINSGNTEEWDAKKRQVLAGRADILLISPERLANEKFMENVLRPVAHQLALLIVDEAHCISDWGHDFRPDYRRISSIMQLVGARTPMLGTTATANERVIADVESQLPNVRVQRGPLIRTSLALQTVHLSSLPERMAWLARTIPRMEGSGIVYVLTKRHAELIAAWLTANGVNAKAYYSGVKGSGYNDEADYRRQLEDELLGNKLKVLVATVALGMGFDKPDIHFVIHFGAPGSIIAYYQQVGRAGRAVPKAYGILMTGAEDERIHEFFRQSAFPKPEQVSKILRALDHSDGLSIIKLEPRVNIRRSQLGKVLKYLSVEPSPPIFKHGSQWKRTALRYEMDHATVQRLTQQREKEWQEVQEYAHTKRCLMRFLAEALDDTNLQDCGKCANCLGRPLLLEEIDDRLLRKAGSFLEQQRIDLDCKRQVDSGAFSSYSFRGNLPTSLRAEQGRVLSRWGDEPWGKMVVLGKHYDHFNDALVRASASLIRNRWKPNPRPAWVTCVPSQNRPKLLPQFAASLAQRLRIPFYPCVQKVRQNQPQKLQGNRYFQCKNLDGAFRVQSPIRSSPVLLVDDIVDSAWTLTIVAALLRQAGSDLVYPFALATTAPG